MNILLSLVFLVGLLLAGAEGGLFPWINLAGVVLVLIFAAAVRGMRRQNEQLSKN